VERVRDVLSRPGTHALDLCCGTGDVFLELEARSGKPCWKRLLPPMLVEARRKIATRSSRSTLFEADALSLPLRNASLDLVTVAFAS